MRHFAIGALVCLAVACAPRGRYSDTIVVLGDHDVQGLDPHVSGELWQTQSVLSNLYESLVALDPQMSLKPGVAESWTNPDEFTWVFQIRREIRFHSGGTLEPDDVVFSILRARDHPRSVLRGSLANVQSVKAVLPRAVAIRTARPDALLAARLRDVFILSRRFVETEGEGVLESRSAGTGPYLLTQRKPGESVDIERFEGHWRGPAAVPKGRFVARSYGDPDTDRLVPEGAALVFSADPGTESYRRAIREAIPRFGPNLSVSYLSFDLRSDETPEGVRLPPGITGNPFRDPRVREAISLVVRLQTLMRDRDNQGTLPTQLVPSEVFGFDPILRLPPYDVARARQLLATTPFKDGFEVDVDVRTTKQDFGEPLTQDLASLGIRARVRSQADSAFFERAAKRGFALYLLRFSCRTGDAQEFFDKWVHSRDPKGGLGEFNFSYDRNPVPELDEEIDAVREELNPALRKVSLQRIMGKVMQARLAIPIFSEKDYTFLSKNLDWGNRADNFRILYEMRTKPD